MKYTAVCVFALLCCVAPASSGAAPAVSGESPETGTVRFEVIDILGRELAARAELRPPGGKTSLVVALPRGSGEADFAVGPADAYVYVYDRGMPLLVDIQRVQVVADAPAYVLVNLLEGSSGNRPLRAFDRDHDMAIDSVELKAGTRPDDAASVPGIEPLKWESPVLSAEAGWYRGELHAHSSHGRGTESVKALIKRAERRRLDFLAITDRNTLASIYDPKYHSKSVVLIPAMEWGYADRGIALIYAPRTFPSITPNIPEAQGIADRVRAQGGVFAIAHPCFPTAPWQWGLSYVNAVEVWCRDWRGVPPMNWGQLDDWLKEQREGKSIHSIALAAATRGHSANGQGALFWDLETSRGLKAGLIGGSNSASPKVPLGSPVTYVQAYEKSVNGIMAGLRYGRTIIARDLDAPLLNFTADILDDGTMNVGIGGFVPLHVPVRFFASCEGAEGKRLEILLNGLPMRSTRIPDNLYTHSFMMVPESYSVFRARIVERPTKMAFGNLDMLVMTGPIYAREIVPYDPTGGENLWVPIESDYVDPATAASLLPVDPSITEIKPRWKW